MPKAKPVYFSGSKPPNAKHVRMHHAAAGDFQPATFQRTAHEGDVDFGGGLGEGEEGRTETHLEVVGLEEAAQEVGDDTLEVGEADATRPPIGPSTWWNIGEWVASESTR
jgi:hypothetical protein